MLTKELLSGWDTICKGIEAQQAEIKKGGIMKEVKSPPSVEGRTRRSVTWGAQTTIFFESLPVKQVEQDLSKELTPSERRDKAKTMNVRQLLGDAFVEGHDQETYVRKRRKSIHNQDDFGFLEDEKHTTDTDEGNMGFVDPMESPPDCSKGAASVGQLWKNSQLVHSAFDDYIMQLPTQLKTLDKIEVQIDSTEHQVHASHSGALGMLEKVSPNHEANSLPQGKD